LNPLLFYASVATEFNNFSVGGDIKHELAEKGKLKDYNFGLAYKFDNLSLSATVEKKLSTVKLDIHQKVNNDTSVAYEFLHNLCDKKCENFDVSAGFDHKLDSESSVKGNLKMSGVASVSYQVKVKPEVKLIFSLENSFQDLPNDGKIGFEISYEPSD